MPLNVCEYCTLYTGHCTVYSVQLQWYNGDKTGINLYDRIYKNLYDRDNSSKQCYCRVYSIDKDYRLYTIEYTTLL